MTKKRMIGFLLVIGVCILIVIAGKQMTIDTNGIIFDIEGKEIGKIYYKEEALVYECEEPYTSFIDVSCQETISLLMEKRNITKKEAERLLVKESLEIFTSFQKSVFDILEKSYQNNENVGNKDFATAISDIDGKILACYSTSSGENKNFVLEKTYPASTIKPLSVYGPAIEYGTIDWSTKIMDEPYQKIRDKEGNEIDWPMNLEPYTYMEQTVKTSMETSMNTIAIRILKEYGIKKACDFLVENFAMDLDIEYQLMEDQGEDEILGNIGMGYLRNGLSQKELLGYYQCIANGGNYIPSYTVLEIKNKKNETYFKHEYNWERVFSEETSYILNRLLKNVVSANGTGAEAMLDGLDLCGKTGTSSGKKDNWFIGMTPEYVCSVWYGGNGAEEENESVVIFKNIMTELPHDVSKKYQEPEGVVKEKYCELSGLLANENCNYVSLGYYNIKHLPDKCNCD